jgi:dihydroxyacetone kinase-like predicted kinase
MRVLSNTIKASDVKRMFLAGAGNLNAKKEWINELNVFPVPDGDTGTNMTMTIMSAAKDVQNLPDDVDMVTLSKNIYSGAMRGARGNSGVILSQLLRGFTKGIRDYNELDAQVIADSFEKAVETAYKAVMKPKEGTILTVAKGASEKASELAKEGCDDLGVFFDEVVKYADEVLAKTPEMLPVITTSTLAKGAVEMSKKNTIVKRLSSIQTFGQMDVLCTDKTGTLTEDKVILEKYMDVSGKESIRILKHAFLNSYFQTGLKN